MTWRQRTLRLDAVAEEPDKMFVGGGPSLLSGSRQPSSDGRGK